MAKELSEWKIAEVDQGREPPGTRPFARYVAADGHPFIDTDGSILNLAKAQSTITWWFFTLPLMAAVLGWLSWSPLVSDQVGALLLILVPVLWILSTSRLQAGLTMACYLMACGVEAPGAVSAYLQPEAAQTTDKAFSFWWGIWLGYNLAYAAGWGLLWSPKSIAKAVGVMVAFALLLLPPVGTLFYGSVWLPAGWLFPGWGGTGFVAYGAGVGLLCIIPRKLAMPAALVVAMLSWLATPADQANPAKVGWDRVNAVSTTLPRYPLGDVPARYMRHFELIERVRDAAQAPGSLILLPENSLGEPEARTQWLWRGLDDELRQRGQTLLIGGLVNGQNVLMVMGAQTPSDPARPTAGMNVPIGSWHPWRPQGHMKAQWFDSPTLLSLDDGSGSLSLTGSIFCWEEFLPWSWLRLANAGTERVVIVSNSWFDASGQVDVQQRRSSQAWARLFDWKIARASNLHARFADLQNQPRGEISQPTVLRRR